MKTINVTKFVAMRASLLQEKAKLEARLAQITQALANQPAAAKPAVEPAVGLVAKRRRKRAKNAMSLHEAVLQVTRSQALSKEQIMAAVLKAGYKFTAKKPANSLNNLLYQKNKFKNTGGKFSPMK